MFASLFLFATSWAWTPNDPLYPQQWGFHAVGMEAAWDFNKGDRPDVKVAVIDSGVDFNLPDFAHTKFDLKNAWDYVGNDALPYDENGQGTLMTAITAQSTDNKQGAAGMAHNTTILPIRVLDQNKSGSDTNVAAGIRRAVDAGADIISLSVGGEFNSNPVFNACQYAREHGVLVTAAVGDGYPDRNQPSYPARHANTLAVGAVAQDLERVSFSQNVNHDLRIGLVAPGWVSSRILQPHRDRRKAQATCPVLPWPAHL